MLEKKRDEARKLLPLASGVIQVKKKRKEVKEEQQKGGI